MIKKAVFKTKYLICILITTVIVIAAAQSPITKVNILYNRIKPAASNSAAVQKKLVSAEDAQNLLISGNKRFITGKVAEKDLTVERRKFLAVNGQKPFAVILSCSDSRVPPEIVFDQGLGDLFVVRNAGNVVDPVVLGSIEYGVKQLNAPLIVVLGHEDCGAVKAAVDGNEAYGSLGAIINKIRPLCNKFKTPDINKQEQYSKCEDENIKNSVSEIIKSPIVKKLVEEKKVNVVPAKYNLITGKVIFY